MPTPERVDPQNWSQPAHYYLTAPILACPDCGTDLTVLGVFLPDTTPTPPHPIWSLYCLKDGQLWQWRMVS